MVNNKQQHSYGPFKMYQDYQNQTKHSASLDIECILKPACKRQGDEYIMDMVCSPTTATAMDRTKLKQ
jgi:hypothetical protein